MIKKKIIEFCLVFVIMCTLFGCGHSVQSNSKGIGIDLSWTGESYIPNVRVGYWDASTAVVRGNTSYTSTTATGGSLFNAGGTQTTTQLYAGPQLNEGYLKQVLISDKTSDQTKIEIAKAVFTAKVPTPAPSVARTTAAAGGTGEKVPQVDAISTGIDKAIETTGEVAKTAAPIVGDVTSDAIKETLKSTKTIIIAAILIVVLAGILIGSLYFRKKKQNKIIVEENTIDPKKID